jgi:hypothetical protein
MNFDEWFDDFWYSDTENNIRMSIKELLRYAFVAGYNKAILKDGFDKDGYAYYDWDAGK